MEILLRTLVSPVPAQIVLGSESEIARAPMDDTSSSSKTGFQFRPPSVDFQIPPEAAPA